MASTHEMAKALSNPSKGHINLANVDSVRNALMSKEPSNSKPRQIWLIRHGSTKLNHDNQTSVDKIRGWSDIPLSDKGKKEVAATADKLADSGINQLVSSDLTRAADTAHAVSKTTDAPVELSQKLRPWDLGELTGKTTKESLPIIEDYARNKPDQAVPKGESFNSFKKRAFSGLKEALSKYPDKDLGLVSHHRFERLLKAWIAAGQPPDFSMDMDTFLSKGEAPANAESLTINPHALTGNP
jgi:2,3-bisphosphoglycerate-dependent phosphoglycerate mutase